MNVRTVPLVLLTLCLGIAIFVLPCLAQATSADGTVQFESPLAHPSPLSPRLGRVLTRPEQRRTGSIVLAQRAIDDDRREPSSEDDEEPAEPVQPEDLGLSSAVPPVPRSPVKAMLLSAAVPGLGELYAGSNTGYLFMGVEAVSWITWASFRSSAGNKEDDMFAFADKHFSNDLFGDKCVSQGDGQSCIQAAETLADFYAHDKPEYYEIISKNPIYKSGWGAVAYENEVEPDSGTEDYRVWIADFAAAQDNDYISYNTLRDDRNDLSRTARSMTVVVLLNHLASAWHSFAAAGGLQTQIKGDVEMELKLSPSLRNPRAQFVLSRAF